MLHVDDLMVTANKQGLESFGRAINHFQHNGIAYFYLKARL